jgi:hypothetical protein
LDNNLKMICANCGGELGVFTERPTSPYYAECKLSPIPPVLSLIPGSTQVCPLCGVYALLQNQQKACEKCGSLLPVPPGGVLTNQGPLDEVIKRVIPQSESVKTIRENARHKSRKEESINAEPTREDTGINPSD